MRTYLQRGCYVYTLLAVSWITASPTSVIATDRPVQFASLTLICTAVLLSLVSSCVLSNHQLYGDNQRQHHRVHRHDASFTDATEEQKTSGTSAPGNGKAQLLLIQGALVALTSRVYVQSRILVSAECAKRNREIWLPFLIAVYDGTRLYQMEHSGTAIEFANGTRSMRADTARTASTFGLLRTWHLVPSAFLLSFGCHLVTGLWTSLDSTIICPVTSADAWFVPALQWIALCLDFSIIIAIVDFHHGRLRSLRDVLLSPLSWAAVVISIAAAWTSIVILYNKQPEYQTWPPMTFAYSSTNALLYTFYQSTFVAALFTSTLYSIRKLGLLNIAIALTGMIVLIPGYRLLLSGSKQYPPVTSVSSTWSFVVIYTAWAIFLYQKAGPGSSYRVFPCFWSTAAVSALIMLHYLRWQQTTIIAGHPIDQLIRNAQNTHTAYRSYASSSKTLSDAVLIYQERYSDTPPPGFDKWYEFARNRSVLVVDEFDRIHKDLLPFRALSPVQLRTQTWELMSNSWNGVAGISIRDGKSTILDVLPTHRWMMEGIVSMLDKFSHYLPDMDVAFNINDECRVAVPYEDLTQLQEEASVKSFHGVDQFSEERAVGWKAFVSDGFAETVFQDRSVQNSFQEWSAPTCPSDSAARGLRPSRSYLCATCIGKHSNGQFVSDWSAAANPCHQPDLANLHGFYLSPSTFKSTKLLRPVFSQSKVEGFNDILYPSAWTYSDKVYYDPVMNSTINEDPAFGRKDSSMFWRGATSEGVSRHGTWRGMARQRMVHMINNLTTSSESTEILLLPMYTHQFQYTKVPRAVLQELGLKADTHLVDKIVRCEGRDCSNQATELGLAGQIPFQQHWKYKYLLDLDGAGFSGRFIPFLNSRSLPFKVALFREWYDSRLVPWLHFVPVDIRLHGLWSTLAYFTGVHGNLWGHRIDWMGHAREAEHIAESGREWSQQALTKADMEVYFFRLLLEWARLTDDKRDEIGFTLS